ncbi:putative peritrophic membrane chitin binding protein [Ixodes scapularis]
MAAPQASTSSAAASSAVPKPARPRKYTADELRERNDAAQRARRQAAKSTIVAKSNLKHFYDSKQAPFPVFLHEAWLQDPRRKEGYLRFLDWLLEKEDVHVVTMSEVLDFMRFPTPKDNYVLRRCTTSQPAVSTCPTPRTARTRRLLWAFRGVHASLH